MHFNQQQPPPHTLTDKVPNLYALYEQKFHFLLTPHIKPLLLSRFHVYIPSAFTLNGDGINDTFVHKEMFFSESEMLIFDPWGGLIYRTNDITKPWNGIVNSVAEVSKTRCLRLLYHGKRP